MIVHMYLLYTLLLASIKSTNVVPIWSAAPEVQTVTIDYITTPTIQSPINTVITYTFINAFTTIPKLGTSLTRL